jgi:hypothetical protein
MSHEWEADRWLERHGDWDRRVEGIRRGLDRLKAEDDLAEWESSLERGQQLATDAGYSNILRGDTFMPD